MTSDLCATSRLTVESKRVRHEAIAQIRERSDLVFRCVKTDKIITLSPEMRVSWRGNTADKTDTRTYVSDLRPPSSRHSIVTRRLSFLIDPRPTKSIKAMAPTRKSSHGYYISLRTATGRRDPTVRPGLTSSLLDCFLCALSYVGVLFALTPGP